MKNFLRKFKIFTNIYQLYINVLINERILEIYIYIKNSTEYWSWTYFCFITLDYCINVFIYFKNKITSILELKMIKYYLFAIHLYSKLCVLNSVLYALADQNMFTVTCSIRTVSNEISNIETNSNLWWKNWWQCTNNAPIPLNFETGKYYLIHRAFAFWRRLFSLSDIITTILNWFVQARNM